MEPNYNPGPKTTSDDEHENSGAAFQSDVDDIYGAPTDEEPQDSSDDEQGE